MKQSQDRRRALLCAKGSPIIPVLDPFRLDRRQILCRAAFLKGRGFRQLVLASTDDAAYARIMPGLVAALHAQTGLDIVEHFRPTRRYGFRRQLQTRWLLMSQVPTSSEAHFRDCARINGALASTKDRALRCLALPVGRDPKSGRFVGSTDMAEAGIATVLDNPWRLARTDVVYLFCRHNRLRAKTVSDARALIGTRPLLVASGNVRQPNDVRELLGAGAGAVAVGSLFETPDWRTSIAALLSHAEAS